VTSRLTAPRINRSSTKRTGQLNAASLNERSVKAILAMIWLWQDTADTERIAAQSEATFWFVLPSLPMFLVIPAMLRHGLGFWPTLALSCLLTMGLYSLTIWALSRLGVHL
jgi:hypothetical protein